MTDPATGFEPLDRPLFGAPDGDAPYRARTAAYGVMPRGDGRLAIARITGRERVFHDLPGGALEPGEDARAAFVREVREETGLGVSAAQPLARADHYWIKPSGERLLNRALYWAAAPEGPAAEPEETDHELVWLDPVEALSLMRHDAAAYAIAQWLRAGRVCRG